MSYTPTTDLAFCAVTYTPSTTIQFGDCNVIPPTTDLSLNATMADTQLLCHGSIKIGVGSVITYIATKTIARYYHQGSVAKVIDCGYTDVKAATQARRLFATISEFVDRPYKLYDSNGLSISHYTAIRHTPGIIIAKPTAIISGPAYPITTKQTLITSTTGIAHRKYRGRYYLPLETPSHSELYYTQLLSCQKRASNSWYFTIATTKAFIFAHTHGNKLSPGRHVYIAAVYVRPKIPRYIPNSTLHFICPQPGNSTLSFQEPACSIYTIPIQRSYLVENTFSLVQATNGRPLYTTSFSLSLSSDSFSWQWSAKVQGRQIEDVLAQNHLEPFEVIATINGIVFRLVIEKVTRDRSFNNDGLSFSGRGLTAYLSQPYSPITTLFSVNSITAQQAAVQALQYNAVPLPDWTIQWEAEDWLIAGGALSNTGTYIEHLNKIAESAGGYIQPALATKTVKFIPYYGSVYNQTTNTWEIMAPWDWDTATPDISFTEDAVATEGIEYLTKTDYNAVYVHGNSSGGVLDFVKIAGTAGDNIAPTIVDALACNSTMTKQRGLRVLGDTGRIVNVTLKLPIHPQVGIILPGTLIRYVSLGTTRTGMVRSVSVSCALPQVRQTIMVETHEYL